MLTDFQIGQDRLFFSSDKLGIDNLSFQTGISSQLSGDINLIVLQDGFANAGAAAQAIVDNNAITADAGLFLYFNTTLGFSRVVFSTDLSDRGQFSVLGNLINQTDVANQTQFTNNEWEHPVSDCSASILLAYYIKRARCKPCRHAARCLLPRRGTHYKIINLPKQDAP